MTFKPNVVYRDTMLGNGARLVLKTFDPPQKTAPEFVGEILFESHRIVSFLIHRGTGQYKGFVIDFNYPKIDADKSNILWTFLPEQQYGPMPSIETKLLMWLESKTPIELAHWVFTAPDARRNTVFRSFLDCVV